MTTQRSVSPGETTLRGDLLPGTGGFLPDGSLRFAVDPDRLCLRADLVDEQTVAVARKRFSAEGIVVLATGAAITSGGVFRIATDEVADGATLLAIGLGTLGALTYLRFFRDTTRETLVQAEPQASSEPEQVSCGSRAASRLLGTMTLRTPWGQEVAAATTADGVAIFPIDWARSPTDPDAAEARGQLGVAWMVTSSKIGSSGTFVPAPVDLDAAIRHLRRARSEQVVTSEPPSVSVMAFVPDGLLETGSRAVLRLTLANRGRGTALGLRATTRSSEVAMHGLVFDFGRLQPGEEKTVTGEVVLPSNYAEPTVAVVLEFTEERGHPPASHAARFDVSQSLCPEGRLSRTEYEKKMDQLRRVRDSGAISEEDFDRFEDLLVRCIE